MTLVVKTDQLVIRQGDCLEVMRKRLTDNSVDAIVTDPPYGLGFMGKAWDDLPPGLDWAKECLRVLKPGGYILAFGGTRTWHRLVVAIEDAGFEIRDSIAWLYGSGFPKSMDVSKAIDKRPGRHTAEQFAAHLIERRSAAGLTRAQVSEKVTGTPTGAMWNWESGLRYPSAKWWPALRDTLDLDEAWGAVLAEAEREVTSKGVAGLGKGKDGPVFDGGYGQDYDVTVPATDDAKRWAGWGTALKPAFEPIVVGRKPLIGTVAANVLAHGTGALNIDATRIATDDNLNGGAYATVGGRTESASLHAGSGMNVPGKTAGTEYVQPTGRWPANVVLDEAMADVLDEQTGTLTSGKAVAGGHKRNKPPGEGIYGGGKGLWVEEGDAGQLYGDSGGASRFFYVAKAPAKERPKVNDVAHPTVKPLALMQWLCRLVTPPNGLILDPFLGSGTTAQAALAEGFRCYGIEREEQYLPLIKQRLGLNEPADESA